MKCLVTGAAGFIGSHLCERLLRDGHRVRGLDGFIPYYPRAVKERNIAGFLADRNFEFAPLDLRTDELDEAVGDVEVIFHLAAMPGLPRSWTEFDLYQSCNLTATHRLVQAALRNSGLQKLVLASTSSVYGRHASGSETLPLMPVSPYGVTKLAAENLCRAFGFERGLPVVVLRYFSVYGPRQRPDMGYQLFIDALGADRPITVFGDGLQVRGNTFVEDCVDATVLAMNAAPGATYNVGGGEAVALLDVIRKLEQLTGRRARIDWKPPRPGDQQSTRADTARIRADLNWSPRVGIDDGLARQVRWHQSQRPAAAA